MRNGVSSCKHAALIGSDVSHNIVKLIFAKLTQGTSGFTL